MYYLRWICIESYPFNIVWDQFPTIISIRLYCLPSSIGYNKYLWFLLRQKRSMILKKTYNIIPVLVTSHRHRSNGFQSFRGSSCYVKNIYVKKIIRSSVTLKLSQYINDMCLMNFPVSYSNCLLLQFSNQAREYLLNSFWMQQKFMSLALEVKMTFLVRE